jgi:cell fate regulator YaaT (PSP1 superfamily)
VRDLAAIFHKRIELHQIGVRDVAKMLGGLGPCGLNVCCATFLHAFDPVSIKMAKDQGLSLNPVKISGTCGRLMCCLRYEHNVYQELLSTMPPMEAVVSLPEGNARVVDMNIPKQTILVELPSRARVEYPSEAFSRVDDNTFEIKKGYKPFQRKKKPGTK